MVAQLYRRAMDSLFVASYFSQGYSGGIVACLHTSWLLPEVLFAADGQSVSCSRCQAQFAVQSLAGYKRTAPVTVYNCLIRDSPYLEDQVPVFISLRNRVD
jgi:hypothetical protein